MNEYSPKIISISYHETYKRLQSRYYPHSISKGHIISRVSAILPLIITMKVLFVALCSLALASAIVVEICDPEITEANFDNLDVKVKPDPIVLKTGGELGLHFAIDLLKDKAGGTVKIDIHNGVLPIPCIEVST